MDAARIVQELSGIALQFSYMRGTHFEMEGSHRGYTVYATCTIYEMSDVHIDRVETLTSLIDKMDSCYLTVNRGRQRVFEGEVKPMTPASAVIIPFQRTA